MPTRPREYLGRPIEAMSEDYIRTARQGLREREVIWRHGVRAAITPFVTALGIDIGFLLGGTVVVEAVFNVPGVGRLAYDGSTTRTCRSSRARCSWGRSLS